MSHKATNWAIEQRGLKPIAKVLLWRLADRHNPDHGCFPDQASLAYDCEISRASVNRYLAELEKMGLIRREQRIDPASKKQLATRYILAFEAEFGTPHVVGRVSDCDTASAGSRVSEKAVPVSQKQGVAVSHSSETLTSKRTSNRTGNGSERASFDDVWEVFPKRRMTNRSDAVAAFDALSDAETHRCLLAAKRFRQWHIEDSQSRNATPDSQAEFRVGLGKWIRSDAWIEALTVPLQHDPVPADPVSGWVYLAPAHPDFQAVEKMLGKKLPVVSASGKRGFRIEEVEQARASA